MCIRDSTYSAHPVGCAVALRTLRIIKEEGFPEQAANKGDYLLRAVTAALADHPHVGDIRGKGLMCAVELVQDKSTKQPFKSSDQIGLRVNQAAITRGLFSRIKGDNYLLAPAIVITTTQMDQAVQILTESIRDVLG